MSSRLLDRDECIDLLARATIGRVALSANALPTVLPVSFRLVDDPHWAAGDGTLVALSLELVNGCRLESP